MFLYKSVVTARYEYQRLTELSINGSNLQAFERNSTFFRLTNREIEIVQLLRQGSKYQSIADKLFISELTVKKHVRNVFEKTGAANRVELIHKLEN